MDNPYESLYRKLSTAQLQEIVQHERDHEVNAVNAAKLELLIRNLGEAERAEAHREADENEQAAKKLRDLIRPASSLVPDTLDADLMQLHPNRKHRLFLIASLVLFVLQILLRLVLRDTFQDELNAAGIVQLVLTFTPLVWLLLYYLDKKAGWYGLTIVFIANSFQVLYRLITFFKTVNRTSFEQPEVWIAFVTALLVGTFYFLSSSYLISSRILEKFGIPTNRMRLTVIFTGLIITWFYIPMLKG